MKKNKNKAISRSGEAAFFSFAFCKLPRGKGQSFEVFLFFGRTFLFADTAATTNHNRSHLVVQITIKISNSKRD
jgi:hypothetical protein